MGAISEGLEKIWNKKQFLLHFPLQLKLGLVPKGLNDRRPQHLISSSGFGTGNRLTLLFKIRGACKTLRLWSHYSR